MEWTEVIVVDRPLAEVQRAVADENELMQWSAWPEATGYFCAVDGDGTSLGSSIVFTDKRGREKGRQRLAAVSADRVEYRLTNRGPGGREMKPEVDFRLVPIDPERTRVFLDFRATAPLPAGVRQLAELVLARRVRKLHVEDLLLLKAHVERSSSTL
jgi:hypothetical protein